MNERQVEQIERLAERMGLDGVAELCADWRALKAENERLRRDLNPIKAIENENEYQFVKDLLAIHQNELAKPHIYFGSGSEMAAINLENAERTCEYALARIAEYEAER